MAAPGGWTFAAAAEIAAAVSHGAASPLAVLEDHIARHQLTARTINGLIQPRHDEARRETTLHEARRGAAVQTRPLAGVPVSVKECFAVSGLVTSLGIPARRETRDVADAWIVERLREAGAIVVGKSNVSQAMFLHDADNPVWGRTNHPLDSGRGPGGSSGGDAALVAAGVVPLAVGTDLAGSVRQPAHACGIAGFLPRSAVLGEGGSFDTMPRLRIVRPRAGFLARHVGDLSLALSAVVAPADVSVARLRVAWWDDAGPIEPSMSIRRAVRESVERLRAQGATVSRIDGGVAEEAAWLLMAILSARGGADVRRLFAGSSPMPAVARLLRLAGLPSPLRPLLSYVLRGLGSHIEARALRTTGPCRAAGLCRLEEARAGVASRIRTLAESFDVIVCPVAAVPALRHGTAARLVLAAAPCFLANLLDLPAGTVSVTRVRPDEEGGRPTSRDPVLRAAAETDVGSAGLPVGVQVIGLPRPAASDDQAAERVTLEAMRLIELGS